MPGFYTWAGDLPSRPGELLRSEPLTPQQGLKSAALNIRILYTSTDGRSNGPIAVSGALFIPEGTPPKCGFHGHPATHS
ncbi:lipoprotein, partial [Pseudomonas syringae pv. actinidiae ICMP 19071]